MMIRQRFRGIFLCSLLIALICGSVSFSSADDALSELSGKTRLKMRRAQVDAFFKGGDKDLRDDHAEDHGHDDGIDIGIIEVERGARAPREVNIFVDGDVINVK